MDFFIDDIPFACSARDLGSIIAAAQQQVDPTGRIIVEVRLDGRPVDDEILAKPASSPLTAHEVQFITARPADLVGEALLSAATMLEEVRATQREAADLLTTDEPAKALEHIRASLQAWQHAQQSVQQSAALLQINLDTLNVNGQQVAAIIDDLAAKLSNIHKQIVSSDWVALSDSVGYDLDTSAQVWVELLNMLRRHVTQMKV
jgi:hypothetical protein